MDTSGKIDISQQPQQSAPKGLSNQLRWVICGLLFFATTINYIDRQVIGILAPTLGKEIGWDEKQYSNIVTCFQIAYAVGLLLSGPVIDYLGTRISYAAYLVFWSLAAVGHGLVRSVFGFAAMRFLLGLGEAGNFPAAVKTVAEWFPARERAFATGIFNSGSNVGAILAPLMVPYIALHYGWQWAFYITGAIGLLWLFFWLPLYRKPTEHKWITQAELNYIESSDTHHDSNRVGWFKLFPHRQLWSIIVARFLTDSVWWFYLYWAPKFLDKNFGVSLKEVGLPLITIYLIADVGSIAGGWLSSKLIARGWSVNRARKLTMLVCAISILPVSYAPQTQNMWIAVLLISLAAAAHQGWSANVYTIASDMFPKNAVGSVVGIGGMAGAMGGIILSQCIGTILQWTGSYTPIFIIAGTAYVGAWLLLHLLAPRLDRVKLNTES